TTIRHSQTGQPGTTACADRPRRARAQRAADSGRGLPAQERVSTPHPFGAQFAPGLPAAASKPIVYGANNLPLAATPLTGRGGFNVREASMGKTRLCSAT